MSNNSNNVHFSGERLICNPYLIIIVPRFARADNDKIRAANESSALKMNIIVIFTAAATEQPDALYIQNLCSIS